MKQLFKIYLLLFFIGCNSKSTPIDAANKTKNSELLAPTFTLQSIKGEKVSLNDFKGKVVLLDFWATWCPPCRMSTPILVKLNQKLKGKNFVIVGINLDENKEVVAPYVKREKIEHLVLYSDNSSVERDYGIHGIPTFFLINQEGKLIKRYPGFYPGIDREWEKDVNFLLVQNK